jgi:hypothetical protein
MSALAAPAPSRINVRVLMWIERLPRDIEVLKIAARGNRSNPKSITALKVRRRPESIRLLHTRQIVASFKLGNSQYGQFFNCFLLQESPVRNSQLPNATLFYL